VPGEIRKAVVLVGSRRMGDLEGLRGEPSLAEAGTREAPATRRPKAAGLAAADDVEL
jgi:hypothetical protein